MKLAWITALIPLVACGRADFDPLPLAVLDCAAPPSFPLGTTVQEIAATTTINGYEVFTTDDQGVITGDTYELSPTDPTHTLTHGVTVAGLATGANGRQIGAFASGDNIELEIPDGPAGAPTGFTRIPLTARLAPNGAQDSITGWTAQAGSIAYSPTGLGAFLQETTGVNSPTVEASTAAANAAPSTPVTLKQGADQVFGATIIAANDKFLLTWIASSTGDVSAQLFDADLQPASGAVVITTPDTNGAKMARAAFASGEFAFVWTRKTPTGADESWFSLRNGQLTQKTGYKLSPDANVASVIAGDRDFLAAWQGQTGIGAARISFAGPGQGSTIQNNGGTPISGDGFMAAWDLVTHNGQPALVWGEVATDGARSLWINPLCGATP